MDKKIISIAFKVRRQVMEWIRGNDGCDPRDGWGACAISSYCLYKALRIQGYKIDFVCGITPVEGHCWNELDNKIIDLTSTQFDKSLPHVYIVDKEYYYKTEIPRFFKYSRDEYNSEIYCKFLRNFSALKETAAWHDQKPNLYKKQINNFVKSLSTTL